MTIYILSSLKMTGRKPSVQHSTATPFSLYQGGLPPKDRVLTAGARASVDIGKIKEKYGDRLVLIGNISVDNLAEKERSDIRDEVRNCIKIASPGGGHILSSSNSWAAGAKLENCLTLVETGRRCGIYPIKV